jgi:hypothetical protein
MNKGLVTSLAITLAGVTGQALAGPYRFRDYASVRNVEPIVESQPVRVTRRLCEDSPANADAPIAARIGDDIRRQIRRWEAEPVCRVVRERAYRKRIVGYWVTYDYGGRTGVRRLSYDPGRRVPVRVNLTPLP